MSSHYSNHICGCYYLRPGNARRHYLPQVKLEAHTTILSIASRTILKQIFKNTSKEDILEIQYAFPLYDGVSIVDFSAKVGDRTIHGLVKEKSEARATYKAARDRGEKAALLEQLPDASDVFITSISNVPANSDVEVFITYVQELKHDAEVDGIRLTIPTYIAPRYGSYPGELIEAGSACATQGMSLTIDVSMVEGVPIKKIVSPSHPIEVSVGTLSTSAGDETPSMSKASAQLALGETALEKDFVLQVVAKDVGVPQAILETHSLLPNQRALMATLVPKFNLQSKPELIFIADRSGSMEYQMPTLISALKVFLKSIPVGCVFNICSFGSTESFLWPKSKPYNRETLDEAIRHVDDFRANFGGTETHGAVKACFETRHTDLQTELMLLTDGDVWSQDELFEYISEHTKPGDVRVFPLGIGGGVSSALIEGIARAGRGFSQMVADKEKLDSKIVRMLKGALTPHISDYNLSLKYADNSIQPIASTPPVLNLATPPPTPSTKPISLFDPTQPETHPKDNEPASIFATLPKLPRPEILQTPHEIPPLFPFSRTCVYLLLAPAMVHLQPTHVILKGTAPAGPLELEIPVSMRETPDQMVHQLAARKAIQELEEGRGWVENAIVNVEQRDSSDETQALAKKKWPTKFALLQQREAVRLGVEFQVGGKYCSFVAVEANDEEIRKKRLNTINEIVEKTSGEGLADWEMMDDEIEVKEAEKTSVDADEAATKSSSRASARAHNYRKKRRARSPMNITSTAARGNSFKAEEDKTDEDDDASDEEVKSSAHRRRFRGRGRPNPYNTITLEAEVEEDGEDDSDLSLKQVADQEFSGGPTAGDNMIEWECSAVQHMEVQSEGQLIDYSEEEDEDMGFGLFDGGTPPRSQIMFSKAAVHRDNWESEEEDEVVLEYTLLHSLLEAQDFTGFWAVEEELYKRMGIEEAAVTRAVATLLESEAAKIMIEEKKVEKATLELAVQTAVVVVFLERRMGEDEGAWELVVEKARGWVEESVEGERVRDELWRVAGEAVGKGEWKEEKVEVKGTPRFGLFD